jgi:hypothetical protein
MSANIDLSPKDSQANGYLQRDAWVEIFAEAYVQGEGSVQIPHQCLDSKQSSASTELGCVTQDESLAPQVESIAIFDSDDADAHAAAPVVRCRPPEPLSPGAVESAKDVVLTQEPSQSSSLGDGSSGKVSETVTDSASDLSDGLSEDEDQFIKVPVPDTVSALSFAESDASLLSAETDRVEKSLSKLEMLESKWKDAYKAHWSVSPTAAQVAKINANEDTTALVETSTDDSLETVVTSTQQAQAPPAVHRFAFCETFFHRERIAQEEQDMHAAKRKTNIGRSIPSPGLASTVQHPCAAHGPTVEMSIKVRPFHKQLSCVSFGQISSTVEKPIRPIPSKDIGISDSKVKFEVVTSAVNQSSSDHVPLSTVSVPEVTNAPKEPSVDANVSSVLVPQEFEINSAAIFDVGTLETNQTHLIRVSLPTVKLTEPPKVSSSDAEQSCVPLLEPLQIASKPIFEVAVSDITVTPVVCLPPRESKPMVRLPARNLKPIVPAIPRNLRPVIPVIPRKLKAVVRLPPRDVNASVAKSDQENLVVSAEPPDKVSSSTTPDHHGERLPREPGCSATMNTPSLTVLLSPEDDPTLLSPEVGSKLGMEPPSVLT